MDTGMPASIDVTVSHELCAHTLESTAANTDDLSVNELKNDVIESPNIDFQKRDNAIDTSCSCSTSLPTTPKPVSAMKGSREKQRAVAGPGTSPPQKLTVKWAPEVYDPVPTSASHAVTDSKPQKQSKKKSKSKSKQKNGNKSSRGNKHKDKLAGKRGCD